MKQLEEKILNRIDELVAKGEQSRNHYLPSPPGTAGAGHIEYAFFNEWKNSSENLIVKVAGEDSHYFTNFKEGVKHAWPEHVDAGIGILSALKDDIKSGFILELKDLVVAEVFTDFLDISGHLLENGYKDPSASLIGAVLEDGLRKIAIKHSVEVKEDEDISSLNTKLANKGIYNRLVQKQVQAWKAVRDSADHGKFKDYKKEDVEAMLPGVRRFLTEYL